MTLGLHACRPRRREKARLGIVVLASALAVGVFFAPPSLSGRAWAQTNLLEWFKKKSAKPRKTRRKQPKLPQAYLDLRKKALAGDVEAMMRLARLHDPDSVGETMPGVRKSLAQAARWYRRAAQAGDAKAQYRLARIVHLGGKGIRQSATTALVLYRAAARQGHPQAMLWLGWALARGEGVRRDPEAAIEWLRKAAQAGERRAMTALGLMYLTGEAGVRDLRQARSWLEKAAAKDEPWALNDLAAMYEKGWGVKRDPQKAAGLYARALRLGLSQAGANLARLRQADAEARGSGKEDRR